MRGFFLRITKFVKMGKMSNTFVTVIFCNLKKNLQKILLDLISVHLHVLICDVKVIAKIRSSHKLRDMVLRATIQLRNNSSPLEHL